MNHGPLLDAIRSLTWPSRRRVSGARTGTHVSRLRGRAPELSEYRAYRQGDDPRDLDWKLLARSDRPFVRLSDDRAIHETWFVVDASASMAFPEATRDKWRTACALTVGLAAIAQRAGDPVALLVPGGTASAQLAPTTRRDAVFAIGAALDAVDVGGNTPLAPTLQRVATGVRLVLVTDLLGDEGAVRGLAATHFASGGEVLVLHLVSRGELDLDPAVALVEDPERPGEPYPVDATSAAGYGASFGAWLDAVRRDWIALGATYVRVVAEDDPVASVRAIVAGARDQAVG
ncbi:MAG: DUF58 domain-containing protein [Gemmatimonadaceae bacterium]|nr:DUF58 domain-containing protein [Gemmatimonadaceae bacterium]